MSPPTVHGTGTVTNASRRNIRSPPGPGTATLPVGQPPVVAPWPSPQLKRLGAHTSGLRRTESSGAPRLARRRVNATTGERNNEDQVASQSLFLLGQVHLIVFGASKINTHWNFMPRT